MELRWNTSVDEGMSETRDGTVVSVKSRTLGEAASRVEGDPLEPEGRRSSSGGYGYAAATWLVIVLIRARSISRSRVMIPSRESYNRRCDGRLTSRYPVFPLMHIFPT